MRGQMPGGRVMLRVKPGWVGQCGGGSLPFCPRFIPSPAGMGHCPGCRAVHTGLSLIWEQQGDWLGGWCRCPGTAVMPSGRLPVPVFAEDHG